jgi:tetratricopeptide (TPR) repeat protein
LNLHDIINLIQQGKYSDAESNIEELENSSLRYSLRSKIKELNGLFDEALILAGKSIELADDNSELIYGLVAQAYAHWRLNQYQLGMNSIENGLKNVLVCENNPKRMKHKGNLLNIQGLIFWEVNDLGSSLSSFQGSLVLREALSDFVDISYTLNNIGNVYLKKNDIDNAKKMYNKALELREKIAYLPPLAGSYNAMGRLFDALNEFDTARQWHQKCLDTWNEVGNNQFIGKSLRFLGINAYNRQSLEEAKNYLSDGFKAFSFNW